MARRYHGTFHHGGLLKGFGCEDVVKQTQVCSVVSVTSFHLTRMDMHISGNDLNANGKYTVLYENLKLSLFKFKSDMRKGKHGPLSFLGSVLLLYPNNPMPGQDTHSVTTSFARDPDKGFISVLWTNIFRAAKKTAVRNQKLINIGDGTENGNEAPAKKQNFFKEAV